MENSTPCKIVTTENFILKLGTFDYVEDVAYQTFYVDRFSGGFSPNTWNVTLLWLFSCPVLSYFLSFQRSSRTARPIFTLNGSNDIVWPEAVFLGVRETYRRFLCKSGWNVDMILPRHSLKNGNRFSGFPGCSPLPFPQIDIIGAVAIVWRTRGKIIRSALCSIVCNNCTQWTAHTFEQT